MPTQDQAPHTQRYSFWSRFRIRQPLPAELEEAFVEFKDIKSIDRIHIAAWIAVALTFCLFGLDYYRIWVSGEFFTNDWYPILFRFHLFGLVFFIPALHIRFNKAWIVQTRLRRGLVIWSMVVMSYIFVMGQSVVIFLDRGSLTMFLGFIFIASWMFSMSHGERTIFLVGTLGVMSWVILALDDLTGEVVPLGMKISSFIEVYFLSLVAFFFDAFDYNLKRTNFLNGLQLAEEKERIRQLEDFKSRFFTNLTHELRTPLTLITGMARQIGEDPKRWAQEGTEIITRNAQNLLHVVNQILDISRIEQGAMPIRLIRGDIIGFVGYVTDAFGGQARDKGITLHYLPREQELEMDFDPDKCSAILSNLLSNAIKFTPSGGHVYVEVHRVTGTEGEMIEFRVNDTGPGIPPEALPKIFDRFYQVTDTQPTGGSGSGIGLSLVQELVRLLNGTIDVSSSVGKGTQFVISLPVSRTAQLPARPLTDMAVHSQAGMPMTVEDTLDGMGNGDNGMTKPEILVIEDNPDVLRFLRICLEDSYTITAATNGDAGIKMALEHVPALVLSDVMMPGTDGLGVCRAIKSNVATSHVPVVLLSAKADPQSRIDGLQSGADVYMVKPFEKDELRAQLHNLMDRFHRLHARYASAEPVVDVPDVPTLAREDEFVKRVREVILAHLGDDQFSVSQLERAVFLSRSQLHKKLVALTGLPASRYIQKIRLRAAREKLFNPDLTIADIAYEVGFTDPNYFTRCYVREYGETPSETRNHRINN